MFKHLEAIGFLFPAMAFSFCTRVLDNVKLGEFTLYAVLTTYFIAHALGAQYAYKSYKAKFQKAHAT